MKFIIKSLLLTAFFLVSLAACKNDTTYADLLKSEKALIAEFIARNEIQVTNTLPTEFPWPKNIYYQTESGMYYRLESQGDINTTDSLEFNDLVIPRFIQYTLNQKSDTTSNWNTIDFAYPTTFNYGNVNQVCKAWHEAASYMKYNNSYAKIIVPSKLGFKSDEDSVTPYCYDITIKYQK